MRRSAAASGFRTHTTLAPAASGASHWSTTAPCPSRWPSAATRSVLSSPSVSARGFGRGSQVSRRPHWAAHLVCHQAGLDGEVADHRGERGAEGGRQRLRVRPRRPPRRQVGRRPARARSRRRLLGLRRRQGGPRPPPRRRRAPRRRGSSGGAGGATLSAPGPTPHSRISRLMVLPPSSRGSSSIARRVRRSGRRSRSGEGQLDR